MTRAWQPQDVALEARSEIACRRFGAAPVEKRMFCWLRLKQLVAKRSPYQIERMEHQRGLMPMHQMRPPP